MKPIVPTYYTRRTLLRTVGATLVLPAVPRIWLPPANIGGMPLDAIVGRFVNQSYSSASPFSAQAVPWLTLYRILGAAGALSLVLNFLGFRPRWARNVDYRSAEECRRNFENAEAAMRSRGREAYAGVYRPQLEPRFAMLAAKTPDGSGAEAATQFGRDDTITVSGQEPDVLAAASRFVSARYNQQGPQLARFAALTNKQEKVAPDYSRNVGVPVTIFHNAAQGFVIHDPRPFGPATAGRVAIYAKGHTNPNNLPEIGLAV